MKTDVEKIPYGVGQFSIGWYFILVILLAILGVGMFAYSQQLAKGLIVTGLRDIGTMAGSAWGLYITFDIYFVGVSFAGITVAALIRLANLKQLRPISRMAELLTVVSLLMAALTIIPDLGRPWRGIINLFRYARPQSPFFGTFTLVIAGYLFGSLVYFYLDGRQDAAIMADKATRMRWFYRLWAAGYQDTPKERERHRKSSFWLAVAILPLLVTATSTLGFVFGIQTGRVGWYGAMQAPGFVIMAGISGVGMLIVIAAAMRWFLGEKEKLNDGVFRWLANLLLLLTIIYLYFMVIDLLTAAYAGHRNERRVLNSLIRGEYALIYWIVVVCLIVPAASLFFQWIRKKYNLTLIFFSAVLVNFSAILKRYIIVVPSQTHGTLFPYGEGHYSPTWVEFLVILGIFALGILLWLLFIKIFPIIKLGEVEEQQKQLPSRKPAHPLRTGLAWLMVAAGFAIQFVSYFFLAAPIGKPSSPAYSNPRLPFSPALFIFGVMLVFLAAVVYEVMPDREKKS